jgi:DNA (cytosine-5)-methyltransferase 1
MDLGLEWSGLGEVVWQCEIDPFCRAVLEKHWPHAKRYEDVCTLDPATLERVDLICFGSPCQDLSSAGSRLGLGGPKSRIFFDCLRVAEALLPEWIVFENVASGASRWVDAVRSELEQLGYATLPCPVSSSWLGAWQERARVFIVAHADRDGEPRFAVNAEMAETSVSSSADSTRREGSWHNPEGRARPPADHWRTLRSDMVRVVSRSTRRLDGARSRIAALGNAPSPQQVEVIGHIVRELAGMGDE